MSFMQENILRQQPLGLFSPGRGKPMMAMVEVTNRCNMTCPICFADAGHPSRDIPIVEIRLYLQRLLEITETPIPIQISSI